MDNQGGKFWLVVQEEPLKEFRLSEGIRNVLNIRVGDPLNFRFVNKNIHFSSKEWKHVQVPVYNTCLITWWALYKFGDILTKDLCKWKKRISYYYGWQDYCEFNPLKK